MAVAVAADGVLLSRIIHGDYAGTSDAGYSGSCNGNISETVEIRISCFPVLPALCGVCGNLPDYVMEVFYD